MQSYEKIKEIGKGSYGVVWLVSHKKDKKNYVLKQIDLRKTSTKDIQSAQQEAKLLSKLKHPNIVSYKDSFESNGFLYIAMLYCEGGDLYTKIKQQNNTHLEETQVVEWFVQIAMAIQYMHEKHILHRDLKTQNIFLTKNKIVKVGDLGIARVLNGNNDMATTIIGTPYYMSPELFSNKPYNSKSDVWALGCCVYEMATLKHAFNAKDINSLVFKILRGKMPPMPNIYSKELITLIEAMLNADPKKRPSVNKILRDSYIRQNINSFLLRTKARQTTAASSSTNNNQPVNLSQEKRHSSPNVIQSASPVKEIFNHPANERKPESKVYNSNLYSNDNPEQDKLFKSPSESNVRPRPHSSQNSRPSSSSSVRENGGFTNSDSDGENKYHALKPKPFVQHQSSSSPSAVNRNRVSESSPQRHAISADALAKPRRSVRISSVVSDIENDQHIELIDKSSQPNENRVVLRSTGYYQNSSASNSSDYPNSRATSASSSVDSNENNQNAENYTPKIISRSVSANSPAAASPELSQAEQAAKVNQSARERRRQKIRQSQNEDNIESKPPVLKKVEKIVVPGKNGDASGDIDPRNGRQRPGPVSKSYGSNIDRVSNDGNDFKDFPFKDSLKLLNKNKPNLPVVSKSEDLSRIKHVQSTPDFRPINKTPSSNNIPINRRPKPTFSCDSSSSSSEPELEPEKAKLKEQEKDKKEVDNFINALNTTLNSICINKPDSEIDEFDEPEVIDENDEILHEVDEDEQKSNSNEETLKPVAYHSNNNNNRHDLDDDNYKSFANMTMGTLNATRKMQDRITILEQDCIHGIGVEAFVQAYGILENFRDEEMEPRLLSLLGKKNYDNYAGKIWQLKFYKDSEKFSRR